MSRFTNKTALITGAGSGIGRAIARKFAAEGAAVIIMELTEESGSATASEIQASGGTARVLACDVSDAASVQKAFESINDLDIVVNNAGIAHVGNVEQTRTEDMDRIYAVNVKGVYHCLHFAVPLLLKKGRGVILNMASIASKIGILDRFAYSMSKGAVLAMTLSVARDYVDKGIRCNCLCPARIHTPFVDGYLEKNYPDRKDEMFQKLSAFQPMGRMGQPEEVAAAAAFLCSDDAAFITGASYDVDGGVIALR
ncbi:MAG TPA: SDR family oxidoreductase [Terrimicrobiaceae bacterium]|nr:SDR family oxidoreductase [Terrimicrobiaceae bacterium]